MRERRLRQLAKSFFFRRKMSETLNQLEDEIRASLMDEEKNEMVTGGSRISLKEDSKIDITELPPSSLDQLDLPVKQFEDQRKEDRYEITGSN